MKKNALIIFFSAMALAMLAVTIHTSLQVSLFDALPRLIRDPWTSATFVDFYFNIAILSSWVFYKEPNKLIALVWTVGFVSMGSIATAAYVVVQLASLKAGEPLSKALVRRD